MLLSLVPVAPPHGLRRTERIRRCSNCCGGTFRYKLTDVDPWEAVTDLRAGTCGRTQRRRPCSLLWSDRTDGDQDPVAGSAGRNIPPEDSSVLAPSWIQSASRKSFEDLGGFVGEHEAHESKLLENNGSSGSSTDRRHFWRKRDIISRMNRNNLKVSDHQELHRTASLRQQQQQSSRKFTTASSKVFKDGSTQLESFPEGSQEFGTLQDFHFGLFTPETPQRKTPAQTQDVSQVQIQVQVKEVRENHMTNEGNGNLPFQSQQKTYKSAGTSHLEEKESRGIQSVSELTASVSSEKRPKHQQTDNEGETAAEFSGEEEVEGQMELAAPRGERPVRPGGVTSEDRWETFRQQNDPRVWTHKHPDTAEESHLAQRHHTSPPVRASSVPPRAWRHQEVIVSFETVNDHIERVPSSDVVTQSTGRHETKTHFHLCQCGEWRPGGNAASHRVKGQTQVAAGRPASAPRTRSTFPTLSSVRSSSGSGGEGEDNQCHQFPKLPSLPPRRGPQDSQLNCSDDGMTSDAPSEDEDGGMIPQKQIQDLSPGSGPVLQQQNITLGNFNILFI
ncbi:unnamed protein product [Pleuronectes platessa]|uniref:Uncharacterized protein n=1 Tax=Pleuronectes platessa TaxID=8262 RepID=A0A9N7VYD0_PLEPL|nr:unnamed protein product [Pleuronectes platessa]